MDKEKKPVLSNNRKKRKRKRLFWLFFIIVVFLIIIALVLSSKKERLIEVQTEKVTRRNITQIVTATGKVQAEKKVNISAEVSGEIISLPYKEGDEVKKGSVVVKIKPDAYYPQLKQQRAGIRVQEENLKAQEVNLRKYEIELKRIQELHQKGLASQSELDNAQANYDATVANMNTIKAQINQQRAGLSAVSYDLSKTTIYAPMSGTVTQLNNEVGEKVLGTMSNMGSNILTISDLSSMICEVEVGETDVTLVKIGDKAKIEIDAFADKIFNGTVYEIANTAKAKGTGTQEEVVNFIVKIRIDKEGYELRPGMSCTADIEVEHKENVIAVPIQAVTTRDEDTAKVEEKAPESEQQVINLKLEEKGIKKIKPKEIVFVNENGFAKKRFVKTGISDDAYIEIIEGINEGDEVIKGGFKAISKELEDNSKIKVENTKKKEPKEEK